MYVAIVDGSPSASDSDSESFERITRSRQSDSERELHDLRARAYGPESDIEADPAAIARLIELETTHVAGTSPLNVTPSVENGAADQGSTSAPTRDTVAASPAAPKGEPPIQATSRERSARSLWRRSTLTLSREWFVLGSIVVAAILGSVVWIIAPDRDGTLHPDATLQPTESDRESSLFIESLIARDEDPNISTLRQFERYHDIDVWSVQVSSVEDSSGNNTCLIAWDRMGGRVQYECLPRGIEVAVNMTVEAESVDRVGEWLADGSMISLHLRENTVDVFILSPPAAPEPEAQPDGHRGHERSREFDRDRGEMFPFRVLGPAPHMDGHSSTASRIRGVDPLEQCPIDS